MVSSLFIAGTISAKMEVLSITLCSEREDHE